MNSQESSATGYSPHELFLGRPAWFLHAPYPEDTESSVGNWVQEQQAKVDKAKAILANANCTLFFTSRAAFVCKKKTRSFRVFPPEN